VSTYVDDDREMPRFRVNRAAMVDPEVFALERDKIFNHTWLYIGHETELKKKNDYKTRKVAGRPLIFARDNKGQIQLPAPWRHAVP
jgi:p-cumate 2,3-dioxygenase alpha subunit